MEIIVKIFRLEGVKPFYLRFKGVGLSGPRLSAPFGTFAELLTETCQIVQISGAF